MQEKRYFTIEEEEAGERLDKFLSAHFPTLSRTHLQQVIEEGGCLINGQPLKKRHRLLLGDRVEITLQREERASSLEPEELPLEILFEDEELLVLNKEAGRVVHPGAGNPSGTLVNGLLYHCKELPFSDDPTRPGIVHRLDKDTSGLLIVAKTREAHQKLTNFFAERQIEKLYYAIAIGRVEAGMIGAPIQRHKRDRRRMVIAEGGKEALTIVTSEGYDGRFSAVKLRLLTGRTHQARLHLAYRKTPILGDPLYGFSSLNESEGVEGQLLHAGHLAFPHPTRGERISFSAPLPPHMAMRWEGLLERSKRR